MSNVIILVNKVNLKGIGHRAFLKTMFFFLRIIHLECPSLLDCADDVAKADTGLMDVGQRGIFKVILCCQETEFPNLVQSFPAIVRDTPFQSN